MARLDFLKESGHHGAVRTTVQDFLLKAAVIALFFPTITAAFPLSEAVWSNATWERHCRNVRTTYNPGRALSTTRLTLTPEDPRFLDFLYWTWANKILEHQVEQIGGTEWPGATNGVTFHWAPASRWETHSVVSFEHAIYHVADEHRWQDNMFADFFQVFGPVQGVGIGQRLSMDKPPTWAAFLEHIGGSNSPYYRYVFHQESTIDPQRHVVVLFGGQGVKFEYSFKRYLEEAAAVLTDCKAYQFFQLYDFYGNGFASRIGWGWSTDSQRGAQKSIASAPRPPQPRPS